MFLRERDRASARNDHSVVRSLTADLRRLGVRDDATLAHPAGKPPRVETREELPAKGNGRPKLPRCEHENVADRCPECNPELVAK